MTFFSSIFVVEMKLIFKYSTSILLSLMILVVSGGFTFSRMVCLESGYTKYAFTEQGDCCAKQNLHSVRIEKPCCDILNQIISVDDFTHTFTKTLKANFNFTPLFISSVRSIIRSCTHNFPQYISSIPPPLGGTDFLSFTRC